MLKIKDILSSRTRNTIFNIFNLYLIRIFNTIVGFIFIPLILSKITPDEYGKLLTILAVISLVISFDFGIISSYRNRFTLLLTSKKFVEIRKITSSAYAILLVLSIFFLIFMLALNKSAFICNKLKLTAIFSGYPNYILAIVYLAASIKFALNLISIIYQSSFKAAKSSLIDFYSNLACFVSFLLCGLLISITSTHVLLILIVMPCLTYLAVSIYAFRSEFAFASPSFRLVSLARIAEFVKSGRKYFIMQLNSILLYSTWNILLAYYYSSENVANFNIASKYFNLISQFLGIILIPLWPAFAEAFIKKDFIWIKKTLNKLIVIWLISCGFIFLMIFFSAQIYSIWLADKANIPLRLTLFVGILTSITSLYSIFLTYLNGIGKINLINKHALAISILYLAFGFVLNRIFPGQVISLIALNAFCHILLCFLAVYFTKKSMCYS